MWVFIFLLIIFLLPISVQFIKEQVRKRQKTIIIESTSSSINNNNNDNSVVVVQSRALEENEVDITIQRPINCHNIGKLEIWMDYSADPGIEFDILTNDCESGEYVSILSQPITLSSSSSLPLKSRRVMDLSDFLIRSPFLSPDSILIIKKTNLLNTSQSVPSIVTLWYD